MNLKQLRNYLASMLVVAISFLGTTTYAQCLTTSAPTNNCTFGDQIDAFSLNGISSPSSPGCSGASGYASYSTPVWSLVAGQTYPWTANVGGGIYNEGFAIWIDLNNNGQYETTEMVVNNAPATGAIGGNLTIPLTATSANGIHMRIRDAYFISLNSGNACTNNIGTYGETEDYLVNISAPSACSGTPIAGNISPAGPISLCAPTSTTLTLSGYTAASGITFQWQQSLNGGTTWTNITGATNTTYTFTPSGNIMIQTVVTCSNGGATATTSPVTISIGGPTYATLPYFQSFETWQNACGNTDAPSASWRNTPVTGNTSWRRDDQGVSTGGWSSNFGTYSPVFTAGVHSARFHSYDAFATNGAGNLDLYVDMSTTGTKQITYDYINVSGTDNLNVQISTDGGVTFSSVDNVVLSSTWSTRTITTTATSATCVLRFSATGDYGISDIGLDNLNIAVLGACSGTPTAGSVSPAGPISMCTPTSTTLTLSGSSIGTGISLQWQQSLDGGTTWTNISGATTNAYTFTPTATVMIRNLVTCSNGGATATSNAVSINFNSPTYATLPFFESFENWQSICNTTDAPSTSWRNSPATGNNSWRRNDQGGSAAWTAATTGAYTPAATDGTYSARFHSYFAGTNTIGNLDLYINLSGAGNKQITYDYINNSGTDSITVQISTDAGATFTPIDNIVTSPTWTTRTITTAVNSATCVLRFKARSDFGNDDIGIDKVNIISFNCSGTPTAGSISPSGPINVCAGASTTLNLSGTSSNTGISIQWQQSTNGGSTYTNITGATSNSLTYSPTVNTLIKAVVTCSFSTLSASTSAVTVNAIPNPTITPGTAGNLLLGTTTANVPFTTTGSPLYYTITWNAAASAVGFTDIVNGNLPGSPLPITIPTTAPIGTYTGTISVANATCAGAGTPISITIVNPPTITLANGGNTALICSGTTSVNLPYTATTVNPNSYSIVWGPAASGAGFANVTNATLPASPIVVSVPATATGGTYTGTFTVSNGISTSTNYTVTVNVADMPNVVLGSNPNVCNGTLFTTIPIISTSGNPTQYSITWNAAALAAGLTNVTNAAFPTGGAFNITGIPATLAPNTYNGTITVKTTNCTAPPVAFSITALPKPTLTSSLNPPAVCSNAPVNYTPTSASGVSTFTWSRAFVSGISNPASNGTGDINEVLNNPTPNPIAVTYAYTFTGSNGCTNTQNVVITVNSYPTLSSPLNPAPTCSYYNFSYTPTSATPNTSFAWTRTSVPGVLNYTASGTGDPNEVLNNILNVPVDVTYTYLLSSNGCTSGTQNVTVTVLPNPNLNSTLNPAAVCSNTLFSYTPTSSLSNSTFSWSRAAISGILNPAATGTFDVNETLVNNTDSIIHVVYTYSVTANGCTSPLNYFVIVPVKPGPTLSSTLTPNDICTNTTFSYAPTFAIAGTNYTWSRTSTLGIANPAATGLTNISETLINTTNTSIAVPYIFTMSALGCNNNQSVIVNVNPNMAPSMTVTAPQGLLVCETDMANFLTNTNVVGGSYKWNVNGVPVTGATNPSYSYVPSNGDNVSCTVTAAPGTCYVPNTYTSNALTIGVNPLIHPTVSLNGVTSAPVGTLVTVNAVVNNAGSSYLVRWSNNGTVFATTTVPTVTYTKGAGTDNIKALVVSQATGCYDSTMSAGHLVAVTVGVNTIATNDDLHIYPNPVKSTLFIDNLKENATYRVLNVIGSVIMHGSLQANTNNSINAKDLASGIYMLELNYKNGEKTVMRIVKE